MEPSAEIAIIPFHFKQKEKDDAFAASVERRMVAVQCG